MSVKAAIKENLALMVGLTFPVLLIIIFMLAAVIPKALGTAPQHELLFVTSRYDYQAPSEYRVDFSVKNNQLMVKVKKDSEKDTNTNNTTKKLMAYDGKSESVREINIDWTKLASTALDKEVALEETRQLHIDSSSTSPDGYLLDGPYYGDAGLLGGMFGGGYRGGGYRLKKGSVAYKLPPGQPDYYGQLQFLGWIIKQPGA